MYSFLLCHWIYFSDHIYVQLGLQHTYFYCFFNVLFLWFLFLPFISLNTISSSHVHLGPNFPSVCPHFQCTCDSPLWCSLHPLWGLLSVYLFILFFFFSFFLFFFKVSSYSCDLFVLGIPMRQFWFAFAEAWWVLVQIHVNLLAWASCIMQMAHIAWDLGHVSCISHAPKPRYCLPLVTFGFSKPSLAFEFLYLFCIWRFPFLPNLLCNNLLFIIAVLSDTSIW